MTSHPPVSVLERPHWRVNIRPEDYQPNRLPDLRSCLAIVEKSTLHLRGWPYPALNPDEKCREFDNTFFSSWCDFGNHVEYWRMYCSGQFLHLFAIREAVDDRWSLELRHATMSHLVHIPNVDWNTVPGFVSLQNLVYTITEIFEFATRLCESGLYTGAIQIDIRMHGIKGFVLTTGLDRCWRDYCSATSSEIGHLWTIPSDTLLEDSAQQSLPAITWFLERFGWLDAPPEVIAGDQKRLLERRF